MAYPLTLLLLLTLAAPLHAQDGTIQLTVPPSLTVLSMSQAQTISIASGEGDRTLCWQGVCRTVRELFGAVKPDPPASDILIRPAPMPTLITPDLRLRDGVLVICEGETCRPFESLTDGLPPVEVVTPLPPLKWATALAVAGPLADGLSSWYAMRQSGPVAQSIEGNAFFHHLFGSNVKGSEILAFKVGQAALLGALVYHHSRSRQDREVAIFAAVMTAAIHSVVTVRNLQVAQRVKCLNSGCAVGGR